MELLTPEAILEHEIVIRISFFFGGLLVFTGLGYLFSYRRFQRGIDLFRWGNNIALTLANSVIMRLLLPTTLVAFAHQLETRGLGLFHWLGVPTWVNIGVSVILFDFVIYWQHVLFHKVAFLWRLHRVHHSDLGFDTTTALRFHPIEILFSIFIKALVILALGIRPEAVIIFEVVLNFSAMFNHANFSFLESIERPLRVLLVTPDMHRIHHSVIPAEANSNYGFCLSIWDRLFASYTKRSVNSLTESDVIGTNLFRNKDDQQIIRLLAQPILSSKSADN